jgi:hypothetical protein
MREGGEKIRGEKERRGERGERGVRRVEQEIEKCVERR